MAKPSVHTYCNVWALGASVDQSAVLWRQGNFELFTACVNLTEKITSRFDYYRRSFSVLDAPLLFSGPLCSPLGRNLLVITAPWKSFAFEGGIAQLVLLARSLDLSYFLYCWFYFWLSCVVKLNRINHGPSRSVKYPCVSPLTSLPIPLSISQLLSTSDLLSMACCQSCILTVEELTKSLSFQLLFQRIIHTLFVCVRRGLIKTIPDQKVLIPGFHFLRRDKDQHGGGIAIHVYSNASYLDAWDTGTPVYRAHT